MEALRRTVHHFYREKKYPTLNFLLVAVKKKGGLLVSVLLCGRVCVRWGFKHTHKKVNDKRYIL